MAAERLIDEKDRDREDGVMLAAIGEALSAFEDEIAQAWEHEFLRTHPENWLVHPEDGLTPGDVSRSQARKFLAAIRNGDRGPHLHDMAQLGRRAAEGGLSFQRLSMLIHYLEKGYLPYLYGAFKDTGKLAEVLVALDHFMHLTIATATNAYFEYVRSKLSEEIATGKVLQRALLPQEAPRLPGLDIGLVYASSTEEALVGGDIYDLLVVDSERVGVLIGDVIGKGIKAAAAAAMVKFMFRGYAYEDPEPSSVLRRLNAAMLRSLEPDEFVTVLYGLFIPATGEFRFAGAGHPQPLLVRRGQGAPVWLESENPALGLVREPGFRELSVKLEKGDILLLYTDGLIEARDSEGEYFGEERVAPFVRDHREFPAQELAESLFAYCSSFVGESLSDDLAIVVLRRV